MTHATPDVEEIVDKNMSKISAYIFGRSISLQDSAKYERQVWIDTLTTERTHSHNTMKEMVGKIEKITTPTFNFQQTNPFANVAQGQNTLPYKHGYQDGAIEMKKRILSIAKDYNIEIDSV